MATTGEAAGRMIEKFNKYRCLDGRWPFPPSKTLNVFNCVFHQQGTETRAGQKLGRT